MKSGENPVIVIHCLHNIDLVMRIRIQITILTFLTFLTFLLL